MPKNEQNFWHGAHCLTCPSSPQAGPTQQNEADVAKRTAVPPADGNWSVQPTWQFFSSSVLKVTQNKTLSGCKSLLVVATHAPACCYHSHIHPPIVMMFRLDSICELIHTICYFLNALVTKSHISITGERTFPMLPFSHGSRISLNWHFLQSYITASTACLTLIRADTTSTV